ncbi:hypothetical protein PMZ80_006232 [Knufia obscura]|uniref:Uncharacterized protein n=1 Tax=Knufia obscura TaxID=1635080 RepID=A0ABR0RL16_9EURO|nr:hypothetical protein PMZ80_006232 [Knufia obscura]
MAFVTGSSACLAGNTECTRDQEARAWAYGNLCDLHLGLTANKAISRLDADEARKLQKLLRDASTAASPACLANNAACTRDYGVRAWTYGNLCELLLEVLAEQERVEQQLHKEAQGQSLTENTDSAQQNDGSHLPAAESNLDVLRCRVCR